MEFKLAQAEEELKTGQFRDAEEVLAEMREKYGV
jgi:hypothetical protein